MSQKDINIKKKHANIQNYGIIVGLENIDIALLDREQPLLMNCMFRVSKPLFSRLPHWPGDCKVIFAE